MTQLRLQDALERAARFGFDTQGWHPALKQALGGLSAEQAAWKPQDERNSVHDIVRHLIHWKRAALQGFGPLQNREAFLAYSASDWQPLPADADWAADVAELERLSRGVLEMIASSSDEALLEPVVPGHDALAWTLLNLATHDAYHAGQISYLRRLQNA